MRSSRSSGASSPSVARVPGAVAAIRRVLPLPTADRTVPAERQRPASKVLATLQSIDRWLALPLVALVWFYRKLISPALPPACRFYPSCSAYADEALRHHGLTRGAPLMVWRLCRCHPFSSGGFDPVPGTER